MPVLEIGGFVDDSFTADGYRWYKFENVDAIPPHDLHVLAAGRGVLAGKDLREILPDVLQIKADSGGAANMRLYPTEHTLSILVIVALGGQKRDQLISGSWGVFSFD